MEILSPAGSPEKLRYAFAYGADAVYAGIPKFSLRAKENPFKETSLKEAVAYTHKLGKKIYITANILPQNRKVDSFKKSLAVFAEIGADALIMADPGMIRFVRQEFPEMPVHLSVQTNTINWPSVEFWYEQGVKRIILSRELSLAEIREIHEKVPEMELESFVHGSICIAYSGRCLLSNYFNHRDANQGTCTNSCRWEYKLHQDDSSDSSQGPDGNFYIEELNRPGSLMPIEEDEHGTYIMNSKDLRAIEYLKELRDAGVTSFKIEGRTKSIYYLCRVTRAYRKAVDDLASGMPLDVSLLEELDKTSNRGFTSAFLLPNSDQQTERFDSNQEYDLPQVYAGIMTGERSGEWAEMDVKNRIELGDTLEYLSPQNQYRFKIINLENPLGNPVRIAHGGNGTVWIKTPQPVEPYAVLAKMQEPAPGETARPRVSPSGFAV
ncbi:MAG: tRNA 5-hydroxyuridine modification protein YegQ [Nitrospinota bacterium]|nr:tRNA 5-hydroxyuridine modification protein YegQ [Nitrospinota bacterium]